MLLVLVSCSLPGRVSSGSSEEESAVQTPPVLQPRPRQLQEDTPTTPVLLPLPRQL